MTQEHTRSAVEKLQRLTRTIELSETTDDDVRRSWPLVYSGFLLSIADSLDTLVGQSGPPDDSDGWAKLDGEWVRIERVGPISRGEFVSRTTDDEPLYGIERAESEGSS